MKIFLLIGGLAYPVLLLYDLSARAGRRVLKAILGGGGSLLLVFSYITLWQSTPVRQIPLTIRIAGFVCAAVFFLLLVYSLLFEIPFRKTYLTSALSDTLVESGTYALCRHPGVLWLLGMLVSTFAAGGRVTHLAAAVLWTALNATYTALQERLFYPQIFGDQYEKYRKVVPMIILTRQSIRRCYSSLRGN